MIHPIITGFVLLLILAAALSLLAVIHRLYHQNRRVLAFMANNAQLVNITPKGRATYLADPSVTFPSRYLLCSRDSAGYEYIVLCGTSTVPFGVVDDMTPTQDTAPSSYPLPVDILGMCEDTKRMIAAGTIVIDNLVSPAANGQVQALPTASGTYWIIGKCKVPTVNGAGDQVEVIPCFPYQLTH